MTTPQSDGRSGTDAPTDGRGGTLLESVQRLAGAGVWTYNVSTGDLWVSERAEGMLRSEFEERADVRAIADCLVASDRARAIERFEDLLEAGEPIDLDVELAGEGTTERYLQLRAEAIQGDGNAVTVHGTVRDVTDAKRQERRIEVLRRTSQQLREANSRGAVAEIMAETSKNILGYVNTTVRLVDGSGETLRTVVSTEECVERAGERPDYAVDEETPAARTYRTGEPELHTDHSTTDDDRDRGDLRSGLYVPIGDHGVLSAGDVVVDAFDERDVEAAILLGQLGAKAITRIGWTKRSRAV